MPFVSIREHSGIEEKGKVDAKDPAGENLLPPQILNRGSRSVPLLREETISGEQVTSPLANKKMMAGVALLLPSCSEQRVAS